MSTPMDVPHLACANCKGRLTQDNYPLQSAACDHSICRKCHTIKTSAADEYVNCPVCQKRQAFHPHLSHVNMTALCAIDMMNEYAKILKAKTEEAFTSPEATTKQQQCVFVSSKKDRPGTEDSIDRGRSKKRQSTAANAIMKTISNDDGSSVGSDDDDYNKIAHRHIVSPAPGQERKVWVKFDKCNQLAFLREIRGDKALIRWESYKYIEEVDLDRIEELDEGRATSRTKRSRRVTMSNSPVANTKTKKHRKSIY